MQYNQLAGMPRRYYDYSDSHGFNAFNNQNTFISILTFLLLVAQLLSLTAGEKSVFSFLFL